MKRLMITLAGVFTAVQLFAQIDPTVEVNRRYDVVAQDIHKPAIPIEVEDSLHRIDVSFDYSIFNRPYEDLYDFTPLESIQLSTIGANRAPVFYGKIGAQYAPKPSGVLPSAELFLQTKPRKGFSAGLYGRHNSCFGGDIMGIWDNESKMQNTLGGGITYDWSTGEMIFDASYSLDRYDFRYLDGLMGDPCNVLHRNNRLSVSANFNSANYESNSIYYDITAKYLNVGKNYGIGTADEKISENNINLNGIVGASFDKHRIYVDINVDFSSRGEEGGVLGLVELSPMYQYDKNRLNARLGIKFASRYGTDGAAAQTRFFPNVDARYAIVKDALWVHAAADGGMALNNYSSLLEECPYLLPYSDLGFSCRKIDARLSLEAVAFGRLSLSAGGAFRIHEARQIFSPLSYRGPVPAVEVGYVDANEWAFNAEVFWKSQDLTIGGNLTYSHYTDPQTKEIVKELPSFTAKAMFRYNFRERLIAQIDFKYRSSVSLVDHSSPIGETRETGPVADVDANIHYLIGRHFSVFVRCGNILGHVNEYVPLYAEAGRNFGGGICFNF